jgi:hypothetical protein
MSQIGTLTTGAGVVTTINLQFVPEFIFVGTSFTNSVLSGLAWNVGGKELVNLSGANPVNAFAKFKNTPDVSTGIITNVFATGMGYLANQQFQLRLTNAGATTPAIYAFSRRRGNGQVLTASQQVVLDAANQRYSNFLSLMFDATNVARADITFRKAKTSESFTDSFEPEELKTLFGLDNPNEAGLLASLTVIDNSNLLANQGVYVESITLYASGGNVTVTVEGLAAI